MKNYYRVTLGENSADAFAGGFIGADYGIAEDLGKLRTEEWRDFSSNFIPIFLAVNPDKSKIAAGLAGGLMWFIVQGFKTGDTVLCQGSDGVYRVGEITGDYMFRNDGPLPHRRPVQWLDVRIERSEMSEYLRKAVNGTCVNLDGYRDEVEKLIDGLTEPKLVSSDADVEDPVAFAMEKHLEEFLVQNWPQTEFGREFDIYQENGNQVGKQYPSDTGPIDILAISKDKKRVLVVELKKGRASDVVVGQILRYMGYVQDVLAEEWQEVSGVIIALEGDQKIRRALSMTPMVTFYRYQVNFKLVKE